MGFGPRDLMKLKCWTFFFDARHEKLYTRTIWVLLRGLPLEIWNEQIFSLIGKDLGPFIRADISFQQSSVMTMAIILFNIDVTDGLTTEITIQKSSMLGCHLIATYITSMVTY